MLVNNFELGKKMDKKILKVCKECESEEVVLKKFERKMRRWFESVERKEWKKRLYREGYGFKKEGIMNWEEKKGVGIN